MIRPSPRLRASTCVALVVLVLIATACSSPSRTPARQAAAKPTSSAAAAVTVSRTFSPYTVDGTLTAAVSSHLTGDCWTSSIALAGAHTYRCLANNQILDPCFAPPSGAKPSSVACFTDPWTPGVQLMLTQPLPTTEPGTRSTPWALQLADGTRCVVLTGTVDQVGSLDLEYRCGSTGEAGLVASTPGTQALQVQYRASDTDTLHAVTVAIAWHG